MSASSKTARVLAAIAALILVATAVFHATGYSNLIDEIGKSSLSSFFRRSLPGIWLFFSWHLLAVACALGWAAMSGFGPDAVALDLPIRARLRRYVVRFFPCRCLCWHRIACSRGALHDHRNHSVAPERLTRRCSEPLAAPRSGFR